MPIRKPLNLLFGMGNLSHTIYPLPRDETIVPKAKKIPGICSAIYADSWSISIL
jgi:hypothetical protein